MIVFDKVTKQFPNGTLALDAVSFHIQPKEFVFITGRSGAGKTTLLRLLLRELIPSEGSIFVDKTDISDLSHKDIPKLRRQIGTAFQDFKLLPDWTIRENIGLGLEIISRSDAEVSNRVDHLLELTNLKDKADCFPSQLSGGELQRTVIARALAPEPKVFFADEPTGNLDPKTASSIVQLLSDINSLGTTVIMATHNQDIIKKLKKRTIQLEKGKLIQDTDKKSKTTKKKAKTK